jgi:hypothetical protein
MNTAAVLRELEGRRIYSETVVCLGCRGYDGVLRRHHCKDELELYCDWCEEWTGHRLDFDAIARQRGRGDPRVRLSMSRMSRMCPA